MTVAEIQVDQRVIGIDSRRFASVEKALVELITNSDDSYARLEKTGAPVTGSIRVGYERHHTGAVLMVTDQAEGMSFEEAARILTYGGAHSPLSRGEGNGRGYFGRGLSRLSSASATAGSRPSRTAGLPGLTSSGARTGDTFTTTARRTAGRFQRTTPGSAFLPASPRAAPG